jgi:hypothetical protein
VLDWNAGTLQTHRIAETAEKEAKTNAELEMILQRLIFGGVLVSVGPDASLGWRPTANRTS